MLCLYDFVACNARRYKTVVRVAAAIGRHFYFRTDVISLQLCGRPMVVFFRLANFLFIQKYLQKFLEKGMGKTF